MPQEHPPKCDGYFIDDGYTFKATIPASGPWKEFGFSYRPALAERVLQYQDQVRNGKPADRLEAIVSLLQGQLAGWTIPAFGGRIDKATLRKVPFPRLDKMVEFVTGYEPGEEEADEKNSGSGQP